MKKILLIFALSACGTNGNEVKTDQAALSADTAKKDVLLTDTSAVKGMNMDTTGMSKAR